MGQKHPKPKFHKKKMHQILEKSVEEPKYIFSNDRVSYGHISNSSSDDEEKNIEKEEAEIDPDNSLIDFSGCNIISNNDENKEIISKLKYSYSQVGILKVKFPSSEELYEYICFLISNSVIATLESNLYNEEKGGKACYISTSFCNEEIKWDNILIQSIEEKESEKNKKINEEFFSNDEGEKENEETKKEDKSIKFAIIIHQNVGKEWFGVIKESKDVFDYPELESIFLLNSKEDKGNNKNQKFGLITFKESNPFLNTYNTGTENDRELIKKSPGSPIYYIDYFGGASIFGLIDEKYEFQLIDKKAIQFLSSEVRLTNRTKEGINQDNIYTLNCADNDFGPLDMKYLAEFDLCYLTKLDLSGNSIRFEGAKYLFSAKFKELEILNLNFNEIGDDGLYELSKKEYKNLKQLHLFYNNISHYGISNLCLSPFIKNLEILSLSENPKITDKGAEYIKKYGKWDRLKVLHMNSTGLTDKGINILSEIFMPLLETLNVQGNTFSIEGKKTIEEIKAKKINVKYKIEK